MTDALIIPDFLTIRSVEMPPLVEAGLDEFTLDPIGRFQGYQDINIPNVLQVSTEVRHGTVL